MQELHRFLEIFTCLCVFFKIVLPDPIPDRPSYKWTYNVYFNSTSAEEKSCGTYYAETFLGSFISKSPLWLKLQCENDAGIEASEHLEVKIARLASVKLFATQVEVSFNVYLSFIGVAGDRDVLIDCGATINDTLLDPNILAQSTFIEEIRHLEGKIVNQSACVAANLSPHHFYYAGAKWTCEENYTYSEDTWSCLPIHNKPPGGFSSTITDEIYLVDPHTTVISDKPVIISPSPATPNNSSSQSTPLNPTTDIEPSDTTWGIELLDQSSTIHLIEGSQAVTVDIQFWANRPILCAGISQPYHCNITISVSIAGGSHPICRRTGKIIPQVAFGRPVWSHASRATFCSMHLPEDQQEPTYRSKIVLKAVQDNKYDGLQVRQLNLGLTVNKQTENKSEVITRTVNGITVRIEDRDRKATCQSINDPHITTFDGLEYNNYYEGEYVLYTHKELQATVHVVYQRCSESVNASCNCAVAIQSGDDVFVIDRCYRKKHKIPRFSGSYQEFNPMNAQLFLNDNLTPGTKIYQEADGKKYYIYLPHGAIVKVMISGFLLNTWVIASPADFHKTKGLCGIYDGNKATDMVLRNGSLYNDREILSGSRGQPVPVIKNWQVDMDNAESLLYGVPRFDFDYIQQQYCLCQEEEMSENNCGFGMDVDDCDMINGVEVTEQFIRDAVTPVFPKRNRRDIEDNTISVISREPILIDKHFVPPKYKWTDDKQWNEATAKEYCSQFIRDNYKVGQLCAAHVPSVNFQQEIHTCMEDIQITGNTSWAISARDAMKEQCLEEIQKNGSLPDTMANHISGSICVNDCSLRGECVTGQCRCHVGFTSSDCSVSESKPPYAAEMPHYGLCDIRNMNCSRVIVYGDNFINSDTLTCCFQECEVSDSTFIPKDVILTRKAIFINFNAVECVVPEIRTYLISVSNNGVNKSDPLLFLPFDPQCNVCSTLNNTCTKIRNSCIINGRCFAEGETSPNDNCMVCKPHNDELQWTIIQDMECRKPWWMTIKLPNWAVAVPAAIGGSIVGVLVGFLLYKCCCKTHKQRSSGPVDLSTHITEESGFDDAILHRNHAFPVFSNDRYDDPPRNIVDNFDDNYFYNDGRGVENGVNSTTYF